MHGPGEAGVLRAVRSSRRHVYAERQADRGNLIYRILIYRKLTAQVGKHTLTIKYNERHVPGSPFLIHVSHPPDASKVRSLIRRNKINKNTRFRCFLFSNDDQTSRWDTTLGNGPKNEDCPHENIEIFEDLPLKSWSFSSIFGRFAVRIEDFPLYFNFSIEKRRLPPGHV